ncbi:MAG: CoA pyrophosphatase [Bryobacteraceae bacterium]|jgi:8-oxo-dGTP pyrophosphatase MutT (NUDIX family)
MDSTRVPPPAESHIPKIAEIAVPDAAVAILHARGPAESVLLIRRTERENDPWSGHWSFPGGRRAPEDPDLLHTALRELEEECGIRIAREQLVAALPPTLARRRVGRFLLVAPFVFRVDDELPTVLDQQEAVEALWVPLRVLRDPVRHALQPVPGLPPEALFPAIALEGRPLWGFTYRLITDWLGLNPQEGPIEQAGFGAAREILDLLLTNGLLLVNGWEEREGAHVAHVKGSIPVALVRAHASSPAPHIPRVNLLEVRPHCIRVVGLAFEEYLIHASG